MRAQRAKLKSRRDDTIIAPGKRSAARGSGREMISLFSFWFGAPNQKEKGGWVGAALPRAAASAALPWATIMPPLRGFGKANQPNAAKPAIAACLRSENHWRKLADSDR